MTILTKIGLNRAITGVVEKALRRTDRLLLWIIVLETGGQFSFASPCPPSLLCCASGLWVGGVGNPRCLEFGAL